LPLQRAGDDAERGRGSRRGLVPHSTGIGAAIAKDGGRGNELDLYANMDDAKANDLLKILVAHHVNLVPTIVHDAPGYPKDWARFEAESRKVMSDPDLLAYYDEDFRKNALSTYDRAHNDTGDVRARRLKGYLNMLRWNKMYDAAADMSCRAAIPTRARCRDLFSMTKWRHSRKPASRRCTSSRVRQNGPPKRCGCRTISAPSHKASWPTSSSSMPIRFRTSQFAQDQHRRAQRQSRAAWLPRLLQQSVSGSGDDRFVVERLLWVEDVKKETFEAGRRGGAAAGPAPDPIESPQPAIESLTPFGVVQGSPPTTLTIKGFNFVRRTRVYIDGMSFPTRG